MANNLNKGQRLDSGNQIYIIEKVLGQGGFGITYLATTNVRFGNIETEIKIAIKEHFISSDCERDSDSSRVVYSNPVKERVENSRKDFISEARRLQRVGVGHPNIVAVNEIFEANNTAYYVMEYLEGESLREFVSHKGKLSEQEMTAVLAPIADAVATLHRNNMTHLDIKPDNIMLVREKDGNIRPVLIDFGLSKHYGNDGNPTSTINTLGCSDGYSPAEQYMGITSFSPESDIYALGATMYYCLTGKLPRKAAELREGELAREVENSVSPKMAENIRRATKLSKFDREKDVSTLFDKNGSQYAIPAASPVQPIRHQAYDVAGTRVIADSPHAAKETKGNNKNVLYVIIIVFAVIMIGVGLYYIFSGKKSASPNLQVAETSHNVVTEEKIANKEVQTPRNEPIHNGIIYLKGTINGKYKVNMVLDLNSKTGKYCYDKYGTKKSMILEITNYVDPRDPHRIVMDEYDPDYVYCGEWSGYYENGVFSGNGLFHDKSMPFKLERCSRAESLY